MTERFSRLGLELPEGPREAILNWSGGRPYPTIAACRYTVHSARKTDSVTVSDFDVQMGIDEAKRHLQDDAA